MSVCKEIFKLRNDWWPNLSRVGRERHQPDSFSGLKWSVRRGKMGEKEEEEVGLRTRMNKGSASLHLSAIKFF